MKKRTIYRNYRAWAERRGLACSCGGYERLQENGY